MRQLTAFILHHLVALFRERSSLYVSILPANKPVSAAVILQYLLVVVILQYLLVVILAGRGFTNTANSYGSPHVPTPGTYGENFTFRYAHLLVVEILQYNTANSYGSEQVEIHLRRRHLRQGTGTFTI